MYGCKKVFKNFYRQKNFLRSFYQKTTQLQRPLLGVSKNNGIPKSSILIGFPIIFTIYFVVPLFLETTSCFSGASFKALSSAIKDSRAVIKASRSSCICEVKGEVVSSWVNAWRFYIDFCYKTPWGLTLCKFKLVVKSWEIGCFHLSVDIAPGAHVRPSTNIGYLTGLLLGFTLRFWF